MSEAIFEKKNILVTGGAGFLGSHLCDELLKTAKVICIDDFSTSDENNIDHLLSDPNFEFIRHDITQPIDLEALPELEKFKIRFQGIQEIYHLACPTSPKHFQEHRIANLLSNSYAVKNVLDLAIRYKAKIMHFSSSVVYGPKRDGNPRIREDDFGIVNFLNERASYDEGKRFAETMVDTYRQVYGLDTKIVRVFRIYGPRLKLDDNQMIPDFISNALDGEDLTILGDPTFSSSFCYVSDCVDACLKLMDSPFNGPLNIGSDIMVNVTTVAQKIIDSIGSKSQIRYGDKHFFMTELCLPDISLAREKLGWMPIVTLDKGLAKTIEDLRASKGIKRR